jgi:hypothetical protein
MKPLLPLFLLVSAIAGAALAAEPLDVKRIGEVTGLSGAWNADQSVYKVTSPRNDVPILVDGWKMPPFMGLTSWAAFKAGKGSGLMVMGDFVLFADEVPVAMKAALGHGLAVTALHNHFFHEEPRVFFMHIGGEGDLDTLAGGVKSIIAAVKSLRAAAPQPTKSFGLSSLPAENHITASEIEKILGTKVQANNGMAKAVIGRTVAMECGCAAGADMGVNTWAAFAGTDDNAVVDGDFAVTEEELQTVLKSLTEAGIAIVAIHSHMTGEKPRTLFLHYWGRGPAVSLAHSLKQALDQQQIVK